MEQTSNNTEHNMTYKIIEEEVKQEEVKQEEEVRQEEVATDIENTTNSEIHVEEAKQAKTRTQAKPKAKPKTQHDTDTN